MSINLGPAGPTPSDAVKLQIRSAINASYALYKTTAEWEALLDAPADNALCVETDASPRKFKIGDGVTLWASLPYANASDVADLTTDGLTAGNMLRVAAGGGLEERTPAETLADIGAAPALGADENYVTDAEKIVIGNTSGTNTGDQDLAALTYAGADPNSGGPTGEYNGQLLHCTGTTPDSWWKWLTDTWIMEAGAATGAVRYDTAQTPLNATQLGQFLDNLGRSEGLLDLGSTVLKAAGFKSNSYYDTDGGLLGLYDAGFWTLFADIITGNSSNTNIISLADASLKVDLGGVDGIFPAASWGVDSYNVTYFDAANYFSCQGSPGFTGEIAAFDGIIVVTGGIITDYNPL